MSVPAIEVTGSQENAMHARMKAIVHRRFGPPDDLEFEETDVPAVNEDSVLVRVRAASVNPLDWHYVRGLPYLVRFLGVGLWRPKENIRGVDVAGVVEAVGKDVTELQPGDEVFGARTGAFAEYVCGRERNFVLKPSRLSFEEAAAIPIAGCTAVQALRDKGQLRQGQSVLVNGAAGGVGTFAVQIAKAFGARVTGVCSTRNLEMVRSIGADRALDYTKENFTREGERYDLIVDNIGNRSLRDLRRALAPTGTLVLVGGGGEGKLLGGLVRLPRVIVMSRFVSQRMVSFMAQINKKDLLVLKELVEAGKLTPVIDRAYPLSETPEAIRYLEAGHARGKVTITVA